MFFDVVADYAERTLDFDVVADYTEQSFVIAFQYNPYSHRLVVGFGEAGGGSFNFQHVNVG